MTKNYVLLKFSDNWADEMDVEGFLVVSKEYWLKREAELGEEQDALHLCIGTNEYLEWEDGETLLDSIEVLELEDAHAQLLAKQFPVTGYWSGGDKGQVLAAFGQTGFLDNVGVGSAY